MFQTLPDAQWTEDQLAASQKLRSLEHTLKNKRPRYVRLSNMSWRKGASTQVGTETEIE